ncbi:unnamed protein product [Camellia sinensis]
MKLSALQQSYTNHRSNSFRGSPPLEPSIDGGSKSPAAVFWLVLHGLCFLISLVLGFRFTGDIAVMELVSQSSLGVRTRAKSLALQRLQSTTTTPPPLPPPPNPESSYLQLRSRRPNRPGVNRP